MGTLYVVATPIGNLGDVTARALEVLGSVDLIAAEDTRVTGRLLAAKSLRKPMLGALALGDVALVSDAGTPAISDPGQQLVAAAWQAGHTVVPVPGPSSVAAAVSVAGFPGPGYCFVGYLPRKAGQLRRLFESLQGAERPTVAFESPHRIEKSLAVLSEALPDREVAVARELTKLHEEVLRGTAAEVRGRLAGRARGEITLVISGA
jgi:16S rRNA (cytidine1402-2'-O)-methyltransferase